MRVQNSVLCLILASTTACASSPEMSQPPGDYGGGYDDYGGAEMAAVDGSMAAPAPVAGAAMQARAPAVALPTAVIGAAAPPAKPAAEGAEPGIESLATTGADSVDQMLIFTGQLAIQVGFSTTSKSIDAAVGQAVAAGGYVAQMTDTTLTLRIPSKRFRKVMTQLEGLGDVLSRGVQALDVSDDFHDLQVQLENLKATRARIEKLLNQSKDLTQILTVEKELQRVTAEIDRIEGRMRLMSSQAAFSTISLGFSERPETRQEIKIAIDDPPPPLGPPRTLPTSTEWIGEVGIHGLMNFSD